MQQDDISQQRWVNRREKPFTVGCRVTPEVKAAFYEKAKAEGTYPQHVLETLILGYLKGGEAQLADALERVLKDSKPMLPFFTLRLSCVLLGVVFILLAVSI